MRQTSIEFKSLNIEFKLCGFYFWHFYFLAVWLGANYFSLPQFFFPFPFLIDRREVGANNNYLSKVPDLGLLVKKENQLCGDELALKY